VQALLQADTTLVPVMAFDRDQAKPLARGKLSMIDNAIDSASGTLRLKAEFSNVSSRLWPGQFVSVQLLAETYPQAIVVDTRAVHKGLDGSYVLRIEDGKARQVAVQPLFEDDAIAVIGAGLNVGDQVIIDGHSRVVLDGVVDVIDTRPVPLRANDTALADAAPSDTPLTTENR
jgi:RND family efflux transporter MFP subunit